MGWTERRRSQHSIVSAFSVPRVWEAEEDDYDWQEILDSLDPVEELTFIEGVEEALPVEGREPFQIREEEILDDSPDGPAYKDLTQVLGQLEDLTEAEEVELAMQFESLAYFAARNLRGPDIHPYNGKFIISEHHEEWSDIIAEHEFACIQASRDHGKTFFCDFAYPIWQAWRHPKRAGFIFSATQPQARRILRDIREEIETNPRLAHLLPSRKERWNDDEIKLANGHTIYARGYGTKVRGAHPVWIVCDDVLNDETAYSETQRHKQNEYFFNAIVPMRVPGGQILVIGTPFHSSDLYAELNKMPAFFCAKYPAILDQGTDKERALWPERYDIKALYKIRDEVVGSIRFTREYLVQPISDDLSLFPTWLFKGKPSEQYNLSLGMPRDFWDKLDVTIYVGVDFAIGTRKDSDFTVIFTVGLDPRGNRWVIDIERFHGATYKEQKAAIIATGRRYRPDLMFLESNQMQAIFGQELKEDTDLPIKEFHTTGLAKHSLEKGLPSMRTLLENGKWRIPRGDARSVEMTDIWITELNQFLFDKGKVQSIGEHDDCAMASWIADQACRAGASFSASFGIEDTLDRKQQKALERGEKVHMPSHDEIIRDQTGVDPKTGKVVHPEPALDDAPDDVFTGLPLAADGDIEDWKPREGAPIPGMAGGMGW
jgi:hypothetical protein